MSYAEPKPQPSSSGSSTLVIILIVVGVLGLFALVCAGLMAAMLIPAVGAARQAAQRMESMNNMKQIGVALHNYHDTYRTFPPAYIADADGNRQHSWRTLILPFVEQQRLHEQYDFHLPWDSPENASVVDTDIVTYRSPRETDQTPLRTNYLVVTGPGTCFDGERGARIADIVDGTSNTILMVEVLGSGIDWAQPEDIDISQLQPGPEGLLVLFADGKVQQIQMSAEELHALATRNGNEPVRPVEAF